MLFISFSLMLLQVHGRHTTQSAPKFSCPGEHYYLPKVLRAKFVVNLTMVFSAAVLQDFRHTPSIFYICLFSFVKIFIYTFSNDFPRGVTIYAQKMNYDWLYHICGNYYNKICPSFLQNRFCFVQIFQKYYFEQIFQMKIWVNRQPLIIFILNLHFYSLAFIF